MREQHIPNLAIKPPSGSAFGCETPPNMPKLHQACLVVGPRGSGKTTATVNLVERLPFDRIFVISPSMKSNKELMSRLKIQPEDVYEDPDDLNCLDSIKAAIDAERDDLEKYQEEMRRYRKLMKAIHSESSLFRLADDDLETFYKDGDFQAPKHKWTILFLGLGLDLAFFTYSISSSGSTGVSSSSATTGGVGCSSIGCF